MKKLLLPIDKLGLLVLIPGMLFLCLEVRGYWSSHWHTKWAFLVFFFSLCWSAWCARRTSFLLFPALLFSLWSGAYISAFQFNHYWKRVPMEMHAVLGRSAFYSMLAILMASFLISTLPKRFAVAVSVYLGVMCVLSGVDTVVSSHLPTVHRGGFSGNPSMNGCLIAALIPFGLALSKQTWIKIVLFLVTFSAVFLTEASNPIGVLGVVGVAYAWARFGIGWKTVASLVLICCALIGSGLYLMPGEFFSSNERMGFWILFFEWWKGNAPILFGAGLGSGAILFPWIQSLQPVKTQFFMWAHSDWFQILFEIGVLGLISVLVAWGYLAIRAFRNPVLFASFMGLSACGLFNYPLRLPTTVLSLTLVTWLILQEPISRTSLDRCLSGLGCSLFPSSFVRRVRGLFS